MVENTDYNVTTLANLELVLVVVDCSFKPIQTGDPSSIRVYNLVRLHEDPSHTYLITMSLNVQEYKLRDRNKRGPALVGMLTLVDDMRDADVEQFYMVATTYPFQRSPDFEAYEYVGVTSVSYLELRSIPRDPVKQPVKHLITARKRGFFSGESQANVRVMYSLLTGLSAKTALTRWKWIGASTTVDSWAWVHCIHFFFGMETVYSLVVLFFVTYEKIRSGKVWVGDPFAPLSTASLVLRGILVILSCFLDSFWSANELAMSRASMLASSSSTLRVHKEFMHADIMVVFLSLVGFISAFFRERIEPAVAIFVFELVRAYRLPLLRSSPAVVREVSTYSSAQNKLGIAKVTPAIAAMSPLRLWSSFQFPTKDPTFLAASFFPTIYLLVSILCFAMVRKLYRCCYPEQTRQRSSQSTDTSGNEKAAMSQKGIVTNFELATGAELQARFGIISDYSNYVYLMPLKFVSADGVYCSGYVIVNGKWLVSIKPFLAIAMMKLFHARFANIYAYEVDGNTVKDTARLVYPHTLLWSDLWHLSVTVLL
jgi:hypothetical protein